MKSSFENLAKSCPVEPANLLAKVVSFLNQIPKKCSTSEADHASRDSISGIRGKTHKYDVEKK